MPVTCSTILDPALPRGAARGRTLAATLAALLALAGCGEPATERPAGASEEPVATADGGHETARSSAPDRPETVTESIRSEGMAEPVELQLFRAPEEFPLPFSTYVPSDMDPTADASGRTAHFTAEFGGIRSEDAFLHLYVFPEGTPAQEALAVMKGYKTSRGVPVSQGLEPIADELPRPDLQWATEAAYRFLYESGNTWYTGTIGVGEWNDRYYMIVRHYPQEYGDGFAPRAALLLERWRWADGSRLGQSAGR